MVLNHSSMAYAFEDQNAVEALVRRTAGEWADDKQEGRLEWTLVRPCMLNDGVAKEVRVLGEQGRGGGWLPGVSRESVAEFVVKTCLERGEWVGGTPVVCN